MKKTLSYVLLITALLISFISCDGANSPNSLNGTWLLTKNVYDGINSSGTPYHSETTYEMIDSEILELNGADYKKYWYDNDRYTYAYTSTTITFPNSSSFTLYSTTYSFTISNGQLIVTRTYDDGNTKMSYYDYYSGSVPPGEWTASSNIDQDYVSATTISTDGTALNASLTIADIDWYKFSATQGSTYTLTTNGGAEDTDTVLVLYDTNGTSYLDRNDDYQSGSLSSQIVWTCPSSGTYYFKVRGFSEYSTGTYTISVQNL